MKFGNAWPSGLGDVKCSKTDGNVCQTIKITHIQHDVRIIIMMKKINRSTEVHITLKIM